MSDATNPDQPHSKPMNIPKPKPYDITEPTQDRGLWCFYLTADDPVLDFVSRLNCILQPGGTSPFQRRLRGRVLFAINPRYDHEETWLWLSEVLESEARIVDLHPEWESAIENAQEAARKD